MKIAVITCYRQPDYVRARTLRTALASVPGVELIVVKNRQKGILRFPEVFWKVLKLRFTERPDAYITTFRSYEIMLYMWLIAGRKPLVFDELVNFAEWMVEHKKLKEGTFLYKLFVAWYGFFVRRARFVLADTEPHAAYSAKIWGLDVEKRYIVLPMAADETIFRPDAGPRRPITDKQFRVFYYGNKMLPLHGIDYVLDAAVKLAKYPNIQFLLLGGRSTTAEKVAAAVAHGAHVAHKDWLPFDEFPPIICDADLALGGPFGGTLQSKFVVNGKTTQFMACETPVVVGRNEVNQQFYDKRNCLVVEQADAQALADAILWGYEHRRELRAIGREGRKTYDQYFAQRVVNERVAGMVAALEK